MGKCGWPGERCNLFRLVGPRMEKYHDATDESLSGDHSVSVLFFFRFVIISMYFPPPFFVLFYPSYLVHYYFFIFIEVGGQAKEKTPPA